MKTHTFECKRDRLTIRGTSFLPEKETDTAIIISHGFMDSSRSTIPYGKELCEEDYATYCFDFCGGCLKGNSDGVTTEMSVFSEVEDLNAVIEHVRNRYQKIILMGFSQGGFVSAITAAQRDDIEKLILVYPALCIPDDARKGKMMFAKFDPENIPDVIKCGPMKLGRCYAETVIDKDPYELIRSYSEEVLIVHGTKDRVVDLSYSEKAQKTYGDLCTLKKILGAGHGFRKAENDVALFHIKEFLKGKREILTVDVRLTGRKIEGKGKDKTITLPFEGSATGPSFYGEILEGAADVQHWTLFKMNRACADYKIKGIGPDGKECIIHVINSNDGTGWKPVLRTDSEALSYLNNADCETILENRKQGPIVHIYC